MKTISVSEFRKNIKKYADLAKSEKVIVSRGEGNAFAIVPLDEVEDPGYNPEFVKKILDRKDEPSNRVDPKDLWNSISQMLKKLKHNLNEFWSRRINQKDRLVYSIDEQKVTVLVVSAKGHYFDK